MNGEAGGARGKGAVGGEGAGLWPTGIFEILTKYLRINGENFDGFLCTGQMGSTKLGNVDALISSLQLAFSSSIWPIGPRRDG